MFRKLLGLITVVGAATQPAIAEVKPDASTIFPYVVPNGYFDGAKVGGKTIAWPLANGLQFVLVYDLSGLVRNVMPEELLALGLTVEQAKERAIKNLEALALTGAIKQQRFTGPNQKPFLLFGGHWAAATCILLPRLCQMGVKNLGSEELCVCIPHREALLMFPMGDKLYRDAMRKMIKQNESDGRKPLTFEFFEITSAGITELKD